MWCCFVSIVGMIILQVPIIMPRSFTFVILMLGIGVFGFVGQLLLTMGLQRETASRGSLGLYVQILFAAIAERWIFHATPSYLSLLGTCIILSCAVYIAVRTFLFQVTPSANAANSSTNQNRQRSRRRLSACHY